MFNEKERNGEGLKSTIEIEQLIENRTLKLTANTMYEKYKEFSRKNSKSYKYDFEDIEDDSDDSDDYMNERPCSDLKELTIDQRIYNTSRRSYDCSKIRTWRLCK